MKKLELLKPVFDTYLFRVIQSHCETSTEPPVAQAAVSLPLLCFCSCFCSAVLHGVGGEERSSVSETEQEQ